MSDKQPTRRDVGLYEGETESFSVDTDSPDALKAAFEGIRAFMEAAAARGQTCPADPVKALEAMKNELLADTARDSTIAKEIEGKILLAERALNRGEAFRAGWEMATARLLLNAAEAARHGKRMNPKAAAKRPRPGRKATPKPFQDEAHKAFLAWKADDPGAPFDGTGGFLEWIDGDGNPTALTVNEDERVCFRDFQPVSLRTIRRWLAEKK